MNHIAGRRQGWLGKRGATALAALALLGLGCHHRHRDARAPEVVVAAPAVEQAPPPPVVEARGSGAEPLSDGSGSGGPPPVGAAPPPPPPPPPGSEGPPPPLTTGKKIEAVTVMVGKRVGNALENAAVNAAANAPRTEIHASVGASKQCYDHECNGARTGRKCFGDHASYCASMCGESNCTSRMACQSECR